MRCVRAWARAYSNSPAADIFQTNGANYFPPVADHPKTAATSLVKTADVLQVRLVGGINGDTKLLLLDRQNDGRYRLPIPFTVRSNVNHVSSPGIHRSSTNIVFSYRQRRRSVKTWRGNIISPVVIKIISAACR